MKNNFERMPAIIFDWIEELSFEELNNSQKKEVSTYFSEQEYDEMHLTSLNIKLVSHLPLANEKQIKRRLTDHFNKFHSSKTGKNSFSGGLFVWRAAALFLMTLSIWLFYKVFDLKKDLHAQEMAVTDTVYVAKEVASRPQLIHDTVYLVKEDRPDSFKTDHSTVMGYNAETILPPNETDNLQAVELENITTMPRGTSMKDDSLLRKFGFVSM
jgi:hypothetical protein